MQERTVYLDHNATTPLHPAVQQALTEAFALFGNPSSMHSFGRAARARVEESRATVARFLNAAPEEIIFVGSGSEANNTVLSLVSCGTKLCARHGGSDIITTAIEHPAVLETTTCLRDRGANVEILPVDGHGRADLDRLAALLKTRKGIVSVMAANNEIGTIQDIAAAAKLAHAHGSLFHTDAVQAFGKIPLDVRALGVDFLTLSAHKIYGPKGVGALYSRKGIPFCPLIRGGHQEAGRRAGTENTLGIIGLGAAVAQREREMTAEHTRLLAFKQRLRDGLAARIPDTRFNGHPTEALANTLNVSFLGAEGEAILLYLDLAGIAASTGSACASGSLDPSHVLLATGIPIECAHGSLRLSMGRDTTDADIDYVLEVLPQVISRLRRMSTAYHGSN
ncbi:MAG TPA: aminotransferase class V-fold PLP-dependent enzyme [bacterium]|nr:aminotransferase class V-fold PLP-dependent enzyme [bacterium]